VPFSHPVFLFFAALVAGALNSVAGGGSFISFPALLFTGMAPIAANATNTAAVWPGSVASAVAYRNRITPAARRLLPPLLITGVIGGVLGACILLRTPQATFLHIVPWLLLGATLLFVASGPITARVNALHVRSRSRRDDKPSGLLMAIALLLELLVAMYVGYFGAGVGILILALLAFMGMEDIHTMNALKTVLVSVVNGVATVTFICARVIVWPQALLMLVAAMLGGYGGAHFAQKIDPQRIRWLVIVIGFAMSLYFFIRR
jgi:uncharacterized membrane protein YfcA